MWKHLHAPLSNPIIFLLSPLWLSLLPSVCLALCSKPHATLGSKVFGSAEVPFNFNAQWQVRVYSILLTTTYFTSSEYDESTQGKTTIFLFPTQRVEILLFNQVMLSLYELTYVQFSAVNSCILINSLITGSKQPTRFILAVHCRGKQLSRIQGQSSFCIHTCWT